MLSIFRACEPRAEVLSGDLRKEIFAARLQDVIEGTADKVYWNCDIFLDKLERLARMQDRWEVRTQSLELISKMAIHAKMEA
jgi:hypothetical protein